MIRVGFRFGFVDDGWLGGLNYFRNLFGAVLALPDRRIDPVVLIASDRSREVLRDFPPVRIVQSDAFGSGSKWARLQGATHRLFKRDLVIETLLRRHRISVLSHSDRPAGCSIPTISWIPDFQHIHLPEFFSAEEVAARKRGHAMVAAAADRVVLSSRDAQQDFCRLFPQWADKARILPFVAEVPDLASLPNRVDLTRRHGITGPYFLVANQFWKHKNHRLIIDALRMLRAQGRPLPVLATGNAHDHRAPGFYAELMEYAAANGVLDDFRVLGVVARNDLLGLMRDAVAILNPSRFEGWNTSIEEAKTLGIRVIASDIPVHREQAPPDALYVHPDKPEELATAMWTVWMARDHQSLASIADFPMRQRAFARAYETIVMELTVARVRRAG